MLSELSTYLPALSLRAACAKDAVTLPARRQLWGSCLWLDVTGFTKLSEKLTKRGPIGIERLSERLNRLYGGISAVVASTGGDVLFFAGDGALCMWEVPDEESLAASARAAVAAAQRVDAELGSVSVASERLNLRQVLITGRMALYTVGGDAGQWMDVLTGSIFEPLATLAALSTAGQLVLSRRSAEALGDAARLDLVGQDAFLLREADLGPLENDLWSAVEAEELNPDSVRARVPEFLAQQLLHAEPAPELRRVSVAFVQWKHASAPPLEELQDLTLATQRAAREHTGSLCQLVQDDKGIVCLVVFGLPGSGQEEHAVRAVRFARRLNETLTTRALEAQIGVASGSVFCGCCGSKRRRQYCVLGSAVIRAARLADSARGEPLADQETFTRASRSLSFARHGALKLKGIEDPLDAYRAGDPRREFTARTELFGRRQELGALSSAIAGFVRGQSSRPIVVCGELGSGKSALLSQIPVLCRDSNVECATSVADAVERHTGYFALRSVMQRWFGRLQDAAETEQLLDMIRAAEQNPELAPLLNPLLLGDLELTPLVQNMAPDTRAENRKRLMRELIKHRLSGGAWVIIIDDADWLDASSFELIKYLRQHLDNLLWIFAERVQRRGASEIVSRLGNAQTIWLEPLDHDSVGQLIASVTGASTVSTGLSAATARAGRGNPLHCLELVRALVASGCLRFLDGMVTHDNPDSELLEIPATLEELIQSRFDRLTTGTRQVLQAASVLGERFEQSVLGEVLRLRATPQQLDQALAEARDEGIIHPLAGAHEFDHGSIRSVVEGLLLPSEQRQLHEYAARALESVHTGNEAAVVARLAFHWTRAENSKNAAEASALAAQQALQGYANTDAVHLFTQALEQDHRWRGALDLDLKRAQWSLWLAQALYSESRHSEARQAYEQAIRWTGFPAPGGARELPFTIVRGLVASARQAFQGRAKQVDPELRERYLAVMRVIHAWGTLDLWEGRLFEAVNKSFLGYRLAQHVGTTAEASETISGFGYLLASTPARRFSEGELLRAVRLGDAANDLQARTSARVLLGMYYTMVGRTLEARAPLQVAQEFADRLGSGLWRHRACFGLGEALLFAGDLAGSQLAFANAARIASDAEPPVEGFANCMRALAAARKGELESAFEIVEGETGVRLVEGPCLLLQRFVSLGIHAELLFRSGRSARALAVADRALSLSESSAAANVFFAALQGHAGIAAVFLSLLEDGTELDRSSGWNRRRLEARAKVAIGQVGAFARMYPAARAHALILSGRYSRLQGKLARATVSWERAERLAQADQQPYQRVQALHWLSLHGPREHRDARLHQAAGLREQFGLGLDGQNRGV